MFLKMSATSFALCLCTAILLPAEVHADDWAQHSVKVEGGGNLSFEFPETWGKKPDVSAVEGMTTIKFGPFGPKKKPVFLVRIDAARAIEPVKAEDLLTAVETEASNLKRIAAETDISINDLQGANVAGHYFSITDQESKPGEFDYLTLAILGADRLIVKCYFFSSDGAPDFAADAMQMMRSISYAPPPPETEGKKKKK